MSLQLNNQNDGYYDNVFLFDSTTFLFNEVRDLIAAGGGGGGGGNFTSQNWEDTNSTIRVLQPNTTGQLLYNSIMLVDMQVLQQNLANYTQTAQLNTLLNGKQPLLTAGTNITISNNVISATGGTGATQAWVLANCLSPLLNQGTVGVGAGLSSTLGANSWVIQVDENTDSRTQFILRDSNNIPRLLQASLTGQLMWNSVALTDLNYVTTQLATKANTFTPGVGLTMASNVLNSYSIELGAIWQSGVEILNFTGAGASVVGNKLTIATTGATQSAATILQLDGVVQNATTLNFIGNNALLQSGVLNISRMAYQDKVVLRYSGSSSDKDLNQGVNGQLQWNGSDVAMSSDLATKQDAIQGFSQGTTYLYGPVHMITR